MYTFLSKGIEGCNPVNKSRLTMAFLAKSVHACIRTAISAVTVTMVTILSGPLCQGGQYYPYNLFFCNRER